MFVKSDGVSIVNKNFTPINYDIRGYDMQKEYGKVPIASSTVGN